MTSSNKRLRVYSITDGRCYYCGAYLSLSVVIVPRSFTVDHVIPIRHGGSNQLENLVPSCRTCNVIKGARRIEWFRARLAWVKMGCKPFSAEQFAYLETLGIDAQNITPQPEPFFGEVLRGEVVTDGLPEYVEMEYEAESEGNPIDILSSGG